MVSYLICDNQYYKYYIQLSDYQFYTLQGHIVNMNTCIILSALCLTLGRFLCSLFPYFYSYDEDFTLCNKFNLILKILLTLILTFYSVFAAVHEECASDADCTCAAESFPHCHHGKCYCHQSTHECNHPDECSSCDAQHYPTCDHHLCHCHPVQP